MTYAAYETSVDQGGLVQCYLFRYGTEAGEFYAYTSHTDEIMVDHGGSLGIITYSPSPVDRGKIVGNGTLDQSALKITLDIGTDLAELFRVYPPSQVVALTVYEGHIDDPDGEFLAVWAGRVITAGRNLSELEVSGEPIATQMLRPGPRRHWQYGCPLALYSQGAGLCNANKAAATVSGTVSAISGNVVTLNAGWEGAFAAAKFVRGQFEWTPTGQSTERRAIIRVSGNDLTLSGVTKDLAVSDSVDIVLACNRKAFAPDGDCQALHNNLPNFGGDPFIPLKKATSSNRFY